MRAPPFAIAIAVMSLATAGSAVASDVVRIDIRDMLFKPAAVTIHAGDRVEWINSDFIDHTATDEKGRWDVSIPAGQTASLPFPEAGTFDYICRYHPGMTGTITVVGK